MASSSQLLPQAPLQAVKRSRRHVSAEIELGIHRDRIKSYLVDVSLAVQPHLRLILSPSKTSRRRKCLSAHLKSNDRSKSPCCMNLTARRSIHISLFRHTPPLLSKPDHILSLRNGHTYPYKPSPSFPSTTHSWSPCCNSAHCTRTRSDTPPVQWEAPFLSAPRSPGTERRLSAYVRRRRSPLRGTIRSPPSGVALGGSRHRRCSPVAA
jgi:hypothetical protein